MKNKEQPKQDLSISFESIKANCKTLKELIKLTDDFRGIYLR